MYYVFQSGLICIIPEVFSSRMIQNKPKFEMKKNNLNIGWAICFDHGPLKRGCFRKIKVLGILVKLGDNF